MGEVFSGFVCGFFLSLISAPVMAVTLLRMRSDNGMLARLLPQGVNTVSVTMVLHFALFIFWTGLGIILGLILLAMEGTGDLPGFPNPGYSILILSAVLAILAPLAVVVTAWSKQLAAIAVLSFLLFGVLMPHMAGWAKFDSPPGSDKPYYAPTSASARPLLRG